MTRGQLEHAIRAACEVSEDSEIWIFGSQAILGEFPNASQELRTSIEMDVQPKNRPDKIDAIDGALGELSLFHQTHGFLCTWFADRGGCDASTRLGTPSNAGFRRDFNPRRTQAKRKQDFFLLERSLAVEANFYWRFR